MCNVRHLSVNVLAGMILASVVFFGLGCSNSDSSVDESHPEALVQACNGLDQKDFKMEIVTLGWSEDVNLSSTDIMNFEVSRPVVHANLELLSLEAYSEPDITETPIEVERSSEDVRNGEFLLIENQLYFRGLSSLGETSDGTGQWVALDDPFQSPLGFVLGQTLRDIGAPCKEEGDDPGSGTYAISGFKQTDSPIAGKKKFLRADLADSQYEVLEEVWVDDSTDVLLRYRKTEQMAMVGQEGKTGTTLNERVYYDIGIPNSVPEL